MGHSLTFKRHGRSHTATISGIGSYDEGLLSQLVQRLRTHKGVVDAQRNGAQICLTYDHHVVTKGGLQHYINGLLKRMKPRVAVA